MYYKGEKYESSLSGSEDFHGQDEQIRNELAARIQPLNGIRVLDVGTGFGKNAEFLSNLIMSNGTIWTIDPSDDALRNAEQLLHQKHLDAHMIFVKGSTEDLPFEDNFFDLVVSVLVLHHLRALETAISEMLRVLKRGGKLILVDWNQDSHVLPFKSRHEKEDFFDPQKVVSLIKKDGSKSPSLAEFQYWYLVDAVK